LEAAPENTKDERADLPYYFAPDIAQGILDGREPSGLSLVKSNHLARVTLLRRNASFPLSPSASGS
jgi:hypothetical protein